MHVATTWTNFYNRIIWWKRESCFEIIPSVSSTACICKKSLRYEFMWGGVTAFCCSLWKTWLEIAFRQEKSQKNQTPWIN